MWILHLLPDAVILWFCNILLLVGLIATLAGFFVHRIPLVWRYQLPFKVVGIALLTLGVYFRGGYAVEQQWRERVAEVEARVAAAEEAGKKATAAIDNRAATRVKIIKEKGLVVKQYIDREVVKYDATCPIPTAVVRAHNAAARNEELK